MDKTRRGTEGQVIMSFLRIASWTLGMAEGGLFLILAGMGMMLGMEGWPVNVGMALVTAAEWLVVFLGFIGLLPDASVFDAVADTTASVISAAGWGLVGLMIGVVGEIRRRGVKTLLSPVWALVVVVATPVVLFFLMGGLEFLFRGTNGAPEWIGIPVILGVLVVAPLTVTVTLVHALIMNRRQAGKPRTPAGDSAGPLLP